MTDPVEYQEYRSRVAATLEPYGGRFLVRGGRAETLEGEAAPARLVVLEFDSVERARAWWGSPEYAEPRAMRQRAATTRMILVEGVEDGPADA